jgi:hypothetical protein
VGDDRAVWAEVETFASQSGLTLIPAWHSDTDKDTWAHYTTTTSFLGFTFNSNSAKLFRHLSASNVERLQSLMVNTSWDWRPDVQLLVAAGTRLRELRVSELQYDGEEHTSWGPLWASFFSNQEESLEVFAFSGWGAAPAYRAMMDGLLASKVIERLREVSFPTRTPDAKSAAIAIISRLRLVERVNLAGSWNNEHPVELCDAVGAMCAQSAKSLTCLSLEGFYSLPCAKCSENMLRLPLTELRLNFAAVFATTDFLRTMVRLGTAKSLEKFESVGVRHWPRDAATEFVKQAKNLVELDLTRTEVFDSEVLSLLSGCSNLEILRIDMEDQTNELFEVLAALPSLKELDLNGSSNYMTFDGTF